jgi:FixJ family two-component response regulator
MDVSAPLGVRSLGIHDMQQRALISVVDDDVSSRESLPDLLQMLGFAALPFASAEEFLASDALGVTKCLILDVSMPGMSGPELQAELHRRALKMPIIFITAHCDGDLRAELLARGAVACLFKPFSEQDLRSALDRAVLAA